METESLQIRIHGDASLQTVVYLPGIHGDWTLVSSFRERMKGKVRFVEFTYPRTLVWSLEEYARAALNLLEANKIEQGVLLGESFGSQVAWPILADPGRHGDRPTFRPTMLILAGGFVRYPFMPLVRFAQFVWRLAPVWWVRLFFHGYALFARWRHRHAPETAAAIHEFVERRTPLDLLAIGHRLALIRESDPRPIALQTGLPVCQLAGGWDPIVFYPAVKAWLRANCPGYRESRVIPAADHNVLGTAPERAAREVLRWVLPDAKA